MLVILPWESHRQWILVGYSPWGHKRVGHDLVTTQQLDTTDYNKELWQW